MSSAIQFAVRDDVGGIRHGAVAGAGQGNLIQVGSGESISLNLARESVVGYEQAGRDLIVKLSDGRTITLAGYFDVAPGDVNHLFLSQNDEIVEVFVRDSGGGVLFADYGPLQGYEKWSPVDSLKFSEADPLAAILVASNDPAGMGPLIPGLLGFGGWGTAGAVAAAAGGAAIIGGGGGSGSGGNGDDDGRPNPTVDRADTTLINTETETPTLDVSGTGAPGDAVTVTIGDKTETTVIGEDGSWQVSFPEANLPGDGDYTAVVVVTTPDGDVTLTGPDFVIDLTPPDVAVTSGVKSTGDVENAAEYVDGVTITGTGESGASVAVTVSGATRTTTVGQDGTWTVTFATSQIATGEYETGMTVTSTDIHGNRTTITDTLVVDTVANSIAFDSVTADNRVNLSESNGTLTITGTATAGATMILTLAGSTQTVTAGADGKWTSGWATGTLTGGQYDAAITAVSTDAAGNTATRTHAFRVDTQTWVAFPAGQAGGDDTINAAERAAGITLTGTAEAGAAIAVTFQGVTHTTTAAANGNWSVAYAKSELAEGTYGGTATVTATDAAGNTATASRTIHVDTDAPEAPDLSLIVRNASAMTGIFADIDGDTVSFHQVASNGTTAEIGVTKTELGAQDLFTFAPAVPDGSYLVIENTDAAGNSASTLFIVNNTNTVTVDLNRDGLADFDFSKIDLTMAPQASLTITEAQLRAITGEDRTLTVSGDSDDHVSLVGGVDTHATRVVDGETYHIYTLGTGGTVLVDDDITTSVI